MTKRKGRREQPTFERPTKEELSDINRALNDKRQNLVQAIKSHYQLVLNTKKLQQQIQRLEHALDNDIEIKDEYGLTRSKDDIQLEITELSVQARFQRTSIKHNFRDFKEKWDIDEKKIEFYWDKWFVRDLEMEL